MRTFLLLAVLAVVPSVHADVSDSGNLTIGNNGVIYGSMTVIGPIAASSVTLSSSGAGAYDLTTTTGIHVLSGAIQMESGSYIQWADGSTSTTAASAAASGGEAAYFGPAKTFGSTVTIQGSAFSVGGSSFSVDGGSASVVYGLTVGSLILSGPSGVITSVSSITASALFGDGSHLTGISGAAFNGGTVANQTTFQSTVTIQDDAFSVGASSFIVAGGSATLAYGFTAQSIGNGGSVMTISAASTTLVGNTVFSGSGGGILLHGGGTFSASGAGNVSLQPGFDSHIGSGGGSVLIYDSLGNIDLAANYDNGVVLNPPNGLTINGSTFTVKGGSATLAYQFDPGSIKMTGSTGTFLSASSVTAGSFWNLGGQMPSGSGTSGTIPEWDGGTLLGNSPLTESSDRIAVASFGVAPIATVDIYSSVYGGSYGPYDLLKLNNQNYGSGIWSMEYGGFSGLAIISRLRAASQTTSDAPFSFDLTDGYFGVNNVTPLSALDIAGNANISGYINVVTTMTVRGNAFSVGGSTFSVSGGWVYPGISISTQAAGSAGALVTVSCPVKAYAMSGGCSCTGGAAATGDVNMPYPTMTAAGSMPTGWQCQQTGTTGAACAAFVLCSLMRF